MFRDASSKSLDLAVVESESMEDLDWDSVRAYRTLYNESHKTGKVRKMPDDEFLCHLGAAGKGEDGTTRPTGAGLLMFGQEWCIVHEFPNYFLDYRKQIGTNRRWEDRFTSQELEWSGNLFDFYERAYDKLRQALEVPFELDGIRRVDETPAHEALREAIVNALSKADFKSSRGVVLRWTAEGIELVNPGCFRVGVEQAYIGGTSDARNKTILKMFSLIEAGERAGSGIPNMVDQWVSCGYGKPRLSEAFDPEVSTAFLPFSADSDNLVSDNSLKNVVRISRKGTRENVEAIVAYLTDHEGARSLDIAEAVGISRTRVNQLLRALIEGEIVEAVGGSRNRVYKLAGK